MGDENIIMYTWFALLCIVKGLINFKVGLTYTPPAAGSPVGTYTDCGQFGGSVDETMSVTITIDCVPLYQTFQHVIIHGSRAISAELWMDEVEVFQRCE